MKREVVVDARGLEPPEPMERILLALDLLKPGEHIRFLIHREPVPLYPILVSRGLRYRTSLMEDGSFSIEIRPAEPA